MAWRVVDPRLSELFGTHSVGAYQPGSISYTCPGRRKEGASSFFIPVLRGTYWQRATRGGVATIATGGMTILRTPNEIRQPRRVYRDRSGLPLRA